MQHSALFEVNAMPESAVKPVSDAGDTKLQAPEPRSRRLIVAGITAALTLAVLMLRLYRLGELPAGIQVSEALNGIDALRVLNGEHAVFFPSEFSGHEGLVVYLIALSITLLGQTDLALRLPTALASAATVFVVFWLGRLLYGRDEKGLETPWRGIFIGGVGAGLMAVSIGQTVLGRTVFRANHLLLLLSLCLALLWWGWRERSWKTVALAGVCAGLVQYTYIPARFTPLLFVAFGLSFLIAHRPDRRIHAKTETPWVLTFGGVAFLVAAPILFFFLFNPEHFFLRSDSLSIFSAEINQGNALGALFDNVIGHLAAFGFNGDVSWRHNFNALPMLNPWEAAFFWLGSGIALWQWKRPSGRLLLLWLAFLLLPAVIARDYAPNTLRMLGATPPVYLLAASGVWEAFQFASKRFFPAKFREGALALSAVLTATILIQGVATFRNYFDIWAYEPGVQFAYEVPWSNFARTLEDQHSSEEEIYLIPNTLQHPSLDYIYRGAASVFYFPRETTDLPYLAHTIESALSERIDRTRAKVVQLNNVHVGWIGNDTGRVSVLLQKYAKYEKTENFTDFQVHSFTNISLDEPWSFYDQLHPMTVHYDGGISLLGFAIGQGRDDFLADQPVIVEKGLPVWMALNWEVTPDVAVDYSISLRMYNREGEAVFQQDETLWNPLHQPTGIWDPDEKIDTLVQFTPPVDIRPDSYELRLVVYNVETLVPTVEIGVWEPEVTLADISLQDPQ